MVYRLIFLTRGEVNDSKAAKELIERIPNFDFVVADKGYDSEPIWELVRQENGTGDPQKIEFNDR